jgi:hypothetical protein
MQMQMQGHGPPISMFGHFVLRTAPLSLAYRIPSYKLPDLTVRQISVLEVAMRLNGGLPRDRI